MANAHEIKPVFMPNKKSKLKLAKNKIANILTMSENLIENDIGTVIFVPGGLFLRRVFGGCKVLSGADELGMVEYT